MKFEQRSCNRINQNVLSFSRTADDEVTSHNIRCFIPLYWLMSALIAIAVCLNIPQASAAKPVLGRYEYASVLETPGIKISALVDSGAQTSAIDARDINTFFRNGREWVHFHIVDERHNLKALELPIVRIAKIISHSNVTLRPVVNLTLMIGSIIAMTQVSLINRSNFPQRLLIGRSFLDGRVLIDTSEEYLHHSHAH